MNLFEWITNGVSRPGSVIPVEGPPSLKNAVISPTSSYVDAEQYSKLKAISIHQNELNSLQSSSLTQLPTYDSYSGQTIDSERTMTNDIRTGALSTDSSTACGSFPRGGLNDSGLQGSILNEAQRLTHGTRNLDYGHPYDDYRRTAALWTSILGALVTPEQAALCMCAVKISRQCNAPKRDNMTDLAGYAWVVQEIVEEGERRRGHPLGT